MKIACTCGAVFNRKKLSELKNCPDCNSSNIRKAAKCPECGEYFHPDNLVVVPNTTPTLLVCPFCYDEKYFEMPDEM